MTRPARAMAGALVAALGLTAALARADEEPIGEAPAATASTPPAPPRVEPTSRPTPPPAGSEAKAAPTQMRSKAMYATGIALTSTAMAATPIGVYLLFHFACSDSEPPQCSGLPELGVPLLVGGVTFAAVGIPLWVIGREPVARPTVARIAVSASRSAPMVVMSGAF